jgi:glyoxylase-like metal-dependent hydrolase (beta-lactamase superfamily II)
MLQLGRWRLASVMAGTFALDGGAMFGVVPRPSWEKQAAPDARNRVRLATRCLLAVDDAGHRVLVDTGMGDRWDAKRSELLAIDAPPDALARGLAIHGLSRADVTDVVLTHLHFDHAGGSVLKTDTGHLECAFPNARWHVQRSQWMWAQAPSERDRASYRRDDFDLLVHCGMLHLVEGACELLPDLELVVSDSHTVGQQLPRFHAGSTHLTFCGDVIPTRAHLRVPWVMAYDLHPLTTVEEKKMILAEALEDDGILFFEHDPDVAACRLREEDGQPVFREAVEI